MPLGLLSLAANLQANAFLVSIYKPTIQLYNKENFRQVATHILSDKPDLIGFSTWCISYPALLLIAQEIKSLSPEIPIVFGGPHASVLAKKTLIEFPFVDYVLSGEADFTFPKFLIELRKPDPDFSIIPGLFYRSGKGTILNNELNESVPNLDDLPVPAYHLVPELKWMKLDVGRGCPFQCTYCSTNDFFSKKYRVKSADRIISEMNTAFKDKGITSFSFAHDMFTLNKKFIFELCDKLISLKKESEIEFRWTCSARIDCVSEEMLVKMKNAGCTDIFFGIETGSNRMQQIIKKKLDVSVAFKIADVCRRLGMNMHASFIIGFPEESEKDFNDTLKTALGLATKGALSQVSELTLLPGTQIYNTHHKDLRFDGQFSNFSRNYCGEEEIWLIKKYPEIFSSFYYLPVNTISRRSILFLRFIINTSRHFRNTLFLLAELIESDIKNKNLLKLYKAEYKSIKKTNRESEPVAMHWIRIFDNCMIKNRENINYAFVRDVFTYESYAALLISLYTSWQFVRLNPANNKTDANFTIKPTPIWKTITTNYTLESVLPGENGWEIKTKRLKKGKYYYLLIATSDNKCKRIKINSDEHQLFGKLSELSFLDFVQQVKHIKNKKEVLVWLKKIKRWGVVVFS